jgi:glycosyltransferase involved in cell wall biosynthesis
LLQNQNQHQKSVSLISIHDPVSLVNSSKASPPKQTKIALLLGGYLTREGRASALDGEKPRIDVMEMEREFGAELFDYCWLENRVQEEPFTRLLLSFANRLGNWSDILALRALWSLRKCDVVYATGEDVGIPTAILMRLLNVKKPRIIMRTEQPVYGSTPFRRSVFTAMLRFAVPRLNVILCRTHAHAAFFRQQLNLPPRRAFFYPESTDTQFFNETISASPIKVLEAIRQPYLLSAGLEMRDYDCLISATRDIPVTVVIGAGSPWAKVGYDARREDLPENVIVSKFIPQEMRELYRSAALVVLPIKPTTRACGMNVILEAWAMGRPVIASRTQGLVSYIEDRQTGYFVAPENAGELREAIQYLLANPDEAQRIGNNGQKKVRTGLTMECYIAAVKKTMMQSAGTQV